jgi:anti-sigma28 factor (negative regulator of flagellin synthesis)
MIGPIDGTPIRPERAEGQIKKAGERATPPAQTPRADRVEISREGRDLAAKGNDIPGLSGERVAEIRQKIADGSYDAPEVLDAVVQRMIALGDV